jgi:hypothetical protein
VGAAVGGWAVKEREGKNLLFLKKKKQKDFWTRFAAAGPQPVCDVDRER